MLTAEIAVTESYETKASHKAYTRRDVYSETGTNTYPPSKLSISTLYLFPAKVHSTIEDEVHRTPRSCCVTSIGIEGERVEVFAIQGLFLQIVVEFSSRGPLVVEGLTHFRSK